MNGSAYLGESPLILIVDDTEANRVLLEDQMALIGYRTVTAMNGEEGLECVIEHQPKAILLDLSMPVMDGETMLGHLMEHKLWSRIPVIIISGQDDMETVARCIERGAEDYLVKPFRPVILKARLTNCMAKLHLRENETTLRRITERYSQELEAQVQEQVGLISKAHLSTIFALSTLAESRDPETGAHLDRMRNYCRILADSLRDVPPYDEVIDDRFVEFIYSASPLHDIGKVGIPDNVLLKPGKLTEDEYRVMQSHCEIGERTLRRVAAEFPDNRFLQMGIEIAASHHEKWDGSGYPNGLADEGIPMPARILALCDVYDALTSKRCYKEAFSHEKSRQIIIEGRGKHFDPVLVDTFLRIEGSFVEVSSLSHEAEQEPAALQS